MNTPNDQHIEVAALRRHAFTFIELLVVIAIIAILAGFRMTNGAAFSRTVFRPTCPPTGLKV